MVRGALAILLLCCALTSFAGRELKRRLYGRYRFVRPDEELRVGDYLLFLDLGGEPLHAASYAGDGFVFTKNGARKELPCIFQSLSTIARIYSKSVRLVALRPPAEDERVAADGAQASWKEVYYRENPTAQYGWLQFDINASAASQYSKLKERSRAMLSPLQMENLERLCRDPRAIAVRKQAEDLYARNRRYVADVESFRSIGFDPFAGHAENAKAFRFVSDNWATWTRLPVAALKRVASYPELAAEYRVELRELDMRHALGLDLSHAFAKAAIDSDCSRLLLSED